MVLEDCEKCMTYWVKNGRNMAGYRLMVSDRHIPEAHFRLVSRPSAYRRAPLRPRRGSPVVTAAAAASEPLLAAAGTSKLWDSETAPAFCSSSTSSSRVTLHTADACENQGGASMFSVSVLDDLPTSIKDQLPNVEDLPEDVDMDAILASESEVDPSVSELQENAGDVRAGALPNTNPYTECKSNEGDDVLKEMMGKDTSWYFPLYKAAMSGDWEAARHIFFSHPKARGAKIRGNSQTALHVAVGSGSRTTFFVQKLLKVVTEKAELETTDDDGCTPLTIAAKVGNVNAAKLLVAKHPDLVYISGGGIKFPIHYAAEYGHRETLDFLLQVTEEGHCPDPYDPDRSGLELLRLIIKAEFYDAALSLLKRLPKLAVSGTHTNLGLTLLAENPSVFSCGRDGGLFEPLIYAYVPQPQKNQVYQHRPRDLESNALEKQQKNSYIHRGAYAYLISAPILKQIRSRRLKHHQAEKLVKRLCREAANNLEKSSDAALTFKFPLLLAAANGTQEIVKEITQSFPDAIWYHDNDNSDIFRLAIENRHHNVYNLMYEMGDLYMNVVRQSVENGDNILHLAGKLAPPHRLRIVSGAALQMQRELQWFKEIESLVQPAYKSKRNYQGKTPQEVFSESHHELMVEGEKWMKDTANSCTVAAALIATIVFAAAITVPGGNNGENGQPMFASEKAFIIFGAADALSLFSSSVSVLMFLSILTSRYAEGDFLHALPKRLIIALFALFLSIASMMVAFSATLYLIFGHRERWILSAVITASCLPVAVFATMQFRLLAEMIGSTYGSGIFKRRGQQSFLEKLKHILE